jgi:siroheme synthase (precorrin-2 oxidase/ferrochelatase)
LSKSLIADKDKNKLCNNTFPAILDESNLQILIFENKNQLGIFGNETIQDHMNPGMLIVLEINTPEKGGGIFSIKRIPASPGPVDQGHFSVVPGNNVARVEVFMRENNYVSAEYYYQSTSGNIG